MRTEKEIKELYDRFVEDYTPWLDSNEIIQESGSMYRKYLVILKYVLGMVSVQALKDEYLI